MKIPKRMAVETTEFMLEYVEQDFYPLDDHECDFIRKVLGFGVYHNMFTPDEDFWWKVERFPINDLPAKRLCARLNVEESEANFLVEMIDEFRRFNTEGEQYNTLRTYLVKKLIKNEEQK